MEDLHQSEVVREHAQRIRREIVTHVKFADGTVRQYKGLPTRTRLGRRKDDPIHRIVCHLRRFTDGRSNLLYTGPGGSVVRVVDTGSHVVFIGTVADDVIAATLWCRAMGLPARA